MYTPWLTHFKVVLYIKLKSSKTTEEKYECTVVGFVSDNEAKMANVSFTVKHQILPTPQLNPQPLLH